MSSSRIVTLAAVSLVLACQRAPSRNSSGSGGANGGSKGFGGASATGGESSATGAAGAGGDATGTGAGSNRGGAGGATGGSGGEGSGGTPSIPVLFTAEPTFTGNDNPAVPQAGILRLETNVAAKIRVDVSGGDETWTLDLPSATRFDKPILGLKPQTSYTLTLTASAGDSTATAGPLAWTTPALPGNFIPLQLIKSEPAKMEPGMTMFAVRDGWMMAQSPILIVDHQGIVRWYFADPDNLVQEDLVQLANGHLFFGRDFCSLREIDMLGNVVHAWHATKWPRACTTASGSVPVDVVDFHHESHVLRGGNILTLSTETRTVDNFPTSETDATAAKKSALVMGSAIVEFSPAGDIVKHISLLDLLDPTRIGRDSLDPQWPSQHVPAGQRAYDWDHANAVVYDEASDAYYVSLRHQDAVVKVSRGDGKLVWILGTPANWVAPWNDKLLAPEGDLLWPFHQHAVKLNPLGLGVYDNGNYRAAAYESVDPSKPEYSRAVAFAVNETAKTVKQVWSYGSSSGADAFFSTGMGDADWLPTTGNVLITNAQRVISAGTTLGADTTYAQLIEVTPSGEKIFDLSTLGKDGTVYPVYRAERIPDLRR
jgi:arylsulfate sulfotransferase